MINWRIKRDEFLIKERKETIKYEPRENEVWLARDEGFVAGLKWVRDGDMQKCIEDNKITAGLT